MILWHVQKKLNVVSKFTVIRKKKDQLYSMKLKNLKYRS